MKKFIFGSLIILTLLSQVILGCTNFSIQHEGINIVGRNYDFYFGNCFLIVNKKNNLKSVLLCNNRIFSRRIVKNSKIVNNFDSISHDSITFSWKSIYGSITFNQFGRGFPLEGMNEMGLVISLLQTRGTQYVTPDSQPPIDVFTWIQYHLDVCSQIGDIYNIQNTIRIHSASHPVHFLISDKYGKSLVIEFIDGKRKYYSDTSLPIKVLTNTLYEQSLLFYRSQWDGNLENNKSSLHRFSIVAEKLLQNKNDIITHKIKYAFKILDSVAQKPNSLLLFFLQLFQKEILAPFTQWSVVYDINKRKIYYKSLINSEIKSILLNDFDFTCSTPCLLLDINARANDNVFPFFVQYSTKSNKKLILKSFSRLSKKFYFYKDVSKSALHNLARLPETFRCK